MNARASARLSWAAVCGVALLLSHPASAAQLVAHWTFEEAVAPYADTGPHGVPLTHDPDTAVAITSPGISGNAAQLNWQEDPGVATRLSATGAVLQTDSFGFSFWINPVYLNANEILISKEMAFDDSLANFLRKAWQVQIQNSGQLELVVRGDDRLAGDFFGAVQSTTALTLEADTPEWIHVAGGYDAATGQLSLYVDGVGDSIAGTPGATHSDGSPFSVGSQRNGAEFVEFAAGTLIDELQLYNGPLSADEVAYLRAHPPRNLAQRPTPKLTAHWTFDESGAPFASTAAESADFLHDTDTTAPLSETPSLIGNAAVLNFGTPPVATRLYTAADAVQTDSFGFSFWMRPDSIAPNEVLLTKEIPEYAGADPDFTWFSWRLSVLPDDDTNGFSALQLVVRGSDRSGPPEPFFGAVTSTAELQLNTQSDDWIHIAGGYDTETGALVLYINDGLSLTSADAVIGTPGADHSDGSPLSLGTARNGEAFVGFAAGVAVDDLQLYDGPPSAFHVARLYNNPGQTLPELLAFRLLDLSVDPVSGGLNVEFESVEGVLHAVEAARTIGTWEHVKSVYGAGDTTHVLISDGELDVSLGVDSRPAIFLRVGNP